MKKAIMALSLLLACAFAGCDLGGAPSDNDNNNAGSQTAYVMTPSTQPGRTTVRTTRHLPAPRPNAPSR